MHNNNCKRFIKIMGRWHANSTNRLETEKRLVHRYSALRPCTCMLSSFSKFYSDEIY